MLKWVEHAGKQRKQKKTNTIVMYTLPESGHFKTVDESKN
jgi:hypothetical protein